MTPNSGGRLRAILFVALIAGCREPYSNDDLAFVLSLPREVALDMPGSNTGTSTSADPRDVPALYSVYLAQAHALRDGLFGALSVLDTLTAGPPTSRESDRRTWGPLVEGGSVWTLHMTRVRFSETATVVAFTTTSTRSSYDVLFDFVLCATPTDPSQASQFADYDCANGDLGAVTVLRGTSAPVDSRDGRAGSFAANLAYARVVDGKGPGGAYLVAYDTRFEQTTIEFVADTKIDEAQLAPDRSYHYEGDSSGAGRFVFFATGNFVTGSNRTDEGLSIAARWLASGRGRADTWLWNGDVCATFVCARVWTAECWDDDLALTHRDANISIPKVGNVADCGPELENPALLVPWFRACLPCGR